MKAALAGGWLRKPEFLNADRLLASHLYGRQPVEAIRFFSADNGEKFFLDHPRMGPAPPLPTEILSTDRMGVTSAAVPVKNTSSAM